MRLAARLLFLRCRRVLISDLEWPAYRTILEDERRRTRREVSACILDIDCVAPMGIIRVLHRSTVAARLAARAKRFRCRGRACDNRGRRRSPTRSASGGRPLKAGQMHPFETIYTDSMEVACNGGGGPLGHPKVYLNLAPLGRVECPYCSRLFVNRAIVSSDKIGAGESRPESPAEGSRA